MGISVRLDLSGKLPVIRVTAVTPVIHAAVDVVGSHKNLREPLHYIDQISASVVKSLADSVHIQESRSIDLTLPKTDGVWVDDVFKKAVVFKRTFTEVLGVSDLMVLSTNDYSELSYFAEDYVGHIRVA